ncbi:TetR/AcrR family transcriptional regulator [Nocardioides panacihumi]|uniref:TetR/AcrR family transcriptional regulator n=1 Tax=Nocardioides panacihumi TaxID=400774 RepID=A0ABN2QUM9_9ACTN
MSEAAPQRRPRNRKQLIVTAAARQFERKGFHDASIADIAAEVGITGPALYRHFRNKHELLVAAVGLEIEQLELAYSGGPDLAGLLDTAAQTLLRSARASSVWQRSAVFLDAEQRHELSERYLAALKPLRAALVAARPALNDVDADALTWGVHSVLGSARAYERAKLDRDRARQLMVAVATRVAEIDDLLPTGPSAPVAAAPVHGLSAASRREAALSAAVRLFAERGFQSVGMDDIGAASGISGPTLYHHFPGKSAILAHVILRALDALYFDLAAVLSNTDDPAEALELTLVSYVRINVAQGDALAALTTEIVNVPEEERAQIRRVQNDYVNEWAVLLSAVRPELSAAESDALVRSAQSVINAMRHHLPGSKGGMRDPLRRIGRAVLGLPDRVDADDLIV